MATTKKSDSKRRNRKPATTPEARENQMVSLAIDLAEKQLSDGTASAQVISHYLKLGSSREQLEQQRIRHDNDLIQAKVSAMESNKRVEELYEGALNAMREYSGLDISYEQDHYDD